MKKTTLSHNSRIKMGSQYGRLLVVGVPFNVYPHFGTPKPKKIQCCVTKCDCGSVQIINTSSLTRSGRATQSCGCLTIEKVSTLGGMQRKHPRIYNIWKGMVERCYNEDWHLYQRYGKRGIRVCDEWRNSYQAFLNWALENGYQDDLQIDRCDNSGNYTSENCQWVTPRKNSQNRRSNTNITAFGETKCLEEWVRDPRCTVSRDCIMYRMRRGMSSEDAISTPRRK